MSRLLSSTEVAVLIGKNADAIDVAKYKAPHTIPKTTRGADGCLHFRLEDVYEFLQDRKCVTTWGLNVEEAAKYLQFNSVMTFRWYMKRFEKIPVRHRVGHAYYYFPHDLDAWADVVIPIEEED